MPRPKSTEGDYSHSGHARIERMKEVEKKSRTLTKDVLGFHINPLSNTMPTEEMIRSTYGPDGFASWAIVNPWPIWWETPGHRKTVERLFRWLKQSEARIMVRLDDPRTTASWRGNPGTSCSVGDRWINGEHAHHIRSLMEFHEVLEQEFGSGFACMIHNNEPWVEGGAQLVYEGEREITAEEYIDFLGESRNLIKAHDLDIPVIMAGITTVTEKRYFDKFRDLVNAGLFKPGNTLTDAAHIHEYEESIGGYHLARFDRIAEWTKPRPLVVGEVGHKDSFAARNKPNKAFKVIMQTWRMLSGVFEGRLVAFCPFALNTIQTDPAKGNPWEIWGTPLYDMLRKEVVG